MRKLEELNETSEVNIIAYYLDGEPVRCKIFNPKNGGAMLATLELEYFLHLPSLQGWLTAEEAPRNSDGTLAKSETYLDNLIAGIAVNSANLKHIAETGRVDGFLKHEIERVVNTVLNKISYQ